jgi:hypothetical protein
VALEADHAGMYVRLREGPLPRCQLGLGRRHLVMREHQVVAATLHVEAHAEMLHGQRAALGVPARTPATQR